MNTAKKNFTAYMNDVWVNRNVAAVDKYISDKELIQHNPNLDRRKHQNY